jgi:hypothetical protein
VRLQCITQYKKILEASAKTFESVIIIDHCSFAGGGPTGVEVSGMYANEEEYFPRT